MSDDKDKPLFRKLKKQGDDSGNRGRSGKPPHGRRKSDGLLVRLAPVVMLLALVMMLVAAVLSVGALKGVSRVDKAIDRVDAAERNTCVRIQNLRGQVNQQGQIIFITLDTIRKGTQGQKNPRTVAYGALADLVEYQPPTNCQKAVDDPIGYVRPDPIPFAQLTPRPSLAHPLSHP